MTDTYPIVIAGQATGYSVRFTVEDLLRLWPAEDGEGQKTAEDIIKEAKNDPKKSEDFAKLTDFEHRAQLKKRIFLLEDGMSDIPANKDGKEIGPGAAFKGRVRDTINIITCAEMSKKLSEPLS